MINLSFDYREGENPILFLHGFMGNKDDWNFFIEKIDKGILLIDLPGHGSSIGYENIEYNFKDTVSEIIRIIEKLNISSINVVAYSMGARIAFGLLNERSDLFEKIILESGNPGIKSKEQRIKRKESDSVLADKILNDGLDKFLDSWYNLELWGNIKEHKEFVNLRKSRLNNVPQELAKSLIQMGAGNQDSYWKIVSELKNDIIFVTGEKDKKYSQIGKELNGQNENIKIHIVENAAHNVHFEKKEEFLKLITDFI